MMRIKPGDSETNCLVHCFLVFLKLSFVSLSLKTILSNEETSLVLTDLEPDTLYDFIVTAIYPDESESEDLIDSQRTCKIYKYKWIHKCKYIFAHLNFKMSTPLIKL